MGSAGSHTSEAQIPGTNINDDIIDTDEREGVAVSGVIIWRPPIRPVLARPGIW